MMAKRQLVVALCFVVIICHIDVTLILVFIVLIVISFSQ
jgi:hypothetical protein